MSLDILDRPDEPAALARWLEDQLTGTGLAATAAELAAVYGPPQGRSQTAAEHLGPVLTDVLERGLRALTAERVRDLLHHPEAILDLQEQIMMAGGSYWQRLLHRRDEYGSAVIRGWAGLESRLASAPAEAPRSVWATPWKYALLGFPLGLAMAASVLAIYFYGVGGKWRNAPTAQADEWGWARPEAFVWAGPASAYLDHIADLANEWFNQRPEDPTALAIRMGQMREGCSALILADLSVLPLPDQEWLREKCRKWAKDINDLLLELESPAKGNVTTVREKMDTLVNRLVGVIRERSKKG